MFFIHSQQTGTLSISLICFPFWYIKMDIPRLDKIDIIHISLNTLVSLPCPLNTSISAKRTSPDL